MLTRDQQRAASAYGTITAVNLPEGQDKFKAKYKGICLKMPAMIQQNGLCQAIAFYEAKASGDTEEAKVRSLYLRDISRLAFARKEALASELEEQARTTEDLNAYLKLSREVMQCALWLKRYAEAVLKVQAEDEGGRS